MRNSEQSFFPGISSLSLSKAVPVPLSHTHSLSPCRRLARALNPAKANVGLEHKTVSVSCARALGPFGVVAVLGARTRGLYWAAAAAASAGIVGVLTMEGQYEESARRARRSQTISLTSGAEREGAREHALEPRTVKYS